MSQFCDWSYLDKLNLHVTFASELDAIKMLKLYSLDSLVVYVGARFAFEVYKKVAAALTYNLGVLAGHAQVEQVEVAFRITANCKRRLV